MLGVCFPDTCQPSDVTLYLNMGELLNILFMSISSVFSVVRELVNRDKLVINDEDEDSNTALHLAALAGHNKVARALIEVGADIEAR